ncbi:DEKNAAC100432 [Brettanomyces naardenensis]|uniref:DEKNAAC100432 n=1 Tax=Brettanomyces naardenensis TaxID=13370 RepID=A0A448YG49_BRENA|nr:DEKNAAC100432 [Brettanomyces naardenensis]
MTGSDSFNRDLEKATTNGEAIHNITTTQSKATTFRHDRDNIYINDVPINKDEFVYAFGGNLNVGKRKSTPQSRTYADPVPAGLAAFSATVVSLGLVQMHAKGVTVANVLLTCCLTTSGLVDLIVGVLCFVVGNTWASCTFLMFGGFWSSYSFLLMNVGSIAESYPTVAEYNQAIGIFFLPWTIFSFGLFACTWKSTYPLFFLMFCVWFFILLFTIGQFMGSVPVYKAGGFFCIMSGVLGFFNMFAGLADKSNSYFVVKPWFLPQAATPPEEKDE